MFHYLKLSGGSERNLCWVHTYTKSCRMKPDFVVSFTVTPTLQDIQIKWNKFSLKKGLLYKTMVTASLLVRSTTTILNSF